MEPECLLCTILLYTKRVSKYATALIPVLRIYTMVFVRKLTCGFRVFRNENGPVCVCVPRNGHTITDENGRPLARVECIRNSGEEPTNSREPLSPLISLHDKRAQTAGCEYTIPRSGAGSAHGSTRRVS